jgi:hypothetical protein
VATDVGHVSVDGDVEVARLELAKFFALAMDAPSPPQMFSQFIDNLWHSMLEGKATEDYVDFSVAACGAIIEHVPLSGEGEVTWVTAYHAKFGQDLPKEWFCNRDGVLDDAAYNEYLRTGDVVASWDCTPGDACRTK